MIGFLRKKLVKEKVLMIEDMNFRVYHINLGNLVNPMKEKTMLQLNVLRLLWRPNVMWILLIVRR